MRPEGQIDIAVVEHENSGSLVFAKRIEGHLTSGSSVPGSRTAGLNDDRAAEFLGATGDIERVQALHIVGVGAGDFLGGRDDIQGPGGRIDGGVLVMPISLGMSQHSPVSAAGTLVMPAPGLMKLSCQSGVVLKPLASKA